MLRNFLIIVLIFVACQSAGAQTPSEFECQQHAVAAIQYVQDPNSPKDMKKIANDLKRMEPWIAVYPDNWIIRFGVGTCAFACENLSLAQSNLKIAYEKSGGDVRVGGMYMLALKVSKQPLEALRVTQELANNNPSAVQWKFMFALNLMGVQRYSQAYPILLEFRTTEIKPPNKDYGSALYALGECELYLGKHEDAVQSLEEALVYVPNAVTFLTKLGEVYTKTGQVTLAKERLSKAIELNKSNPDALYWMGVCTEQEDTRMANEYFREALKQGEERLKINSDNGKDHFLLFLICQKLGEIKKAQEYKKSAEDLHVTFQAPSKKGIELIP